MCAAGTAVYAKEWASVGGPPLLAANIDVARFGVEYGLLHVFTQGLPLALLIATWARVARPKSFTSMQRRLLEAIICFVPIPLALGGGRTLVLVPVLTAIVVAARYVSPKVARRWVMVIPVAIILFSSVVFLTRESQHTGPVTGTILYGDTGTSSSPVAAAFRSLSINLGEQLRVVKELRDADISSAPFTTSIYFLHNFIPRAVDVHTISGPNAGGWLTTMYAGQLLLDFGLVGALLFGLALGAASHRLYVRFAEGRSVRVIWVYAYLAAPIAFSFYINIFLFFVYPLLDLAALFVLSRVLIVPGARAVPKSSRASLSEAG
jgi:oligosaccharide repeat unit polymerase